jgi:integral membrane protein
MKNYISTSIGFLRLIAFLEGVSFLILLFVAMPIKYVLGNDALVKTVGQVHGLLFVLLILITLFVGYEKQWKLTGITLKVLASSIIPFGTFYVDYKILKKLV